MVLGCRQLLALVPMPFLVRPDGLDALISGPSDTLDVHDLPVYMHGWCRRISVPAQGARLAPTEWSPRVGHLSPSQPPVRVSCVTSAEPTVHHPSASAQPRGLDRDRAPHKRQPCSLSGRRW
ncbi:uncharacterized protein BO80DRAFT_141050 [Aspergillus ibericus CBS 121593]|uniref:Uncharacterized protein n=1 Tax=Aspergillus ibericus CBS 121593 TaxID=1448316 RepID=A0A395GYU7_9EURO|nr:hypothetical protein BO80DRAFT_141050 [Aspergillus ibericus CBS 121593]RAK99203.1 hypothetical protein BO80DRAFT_141050 [Aspergillus ibericus CBS 121593]